MTLYRVTAEFPEGVVLWSRAGGWLTSNRTRADVFDETEADALVETLSKSCPTATISKFEDRP